MIKIVSDLLLCMPVRAPQRPCWLDVPHKCLNLMWLPMYHQARLCELFKPYIVDSTISMPMYADIFNANDLAFGDYYELESGEFIPKRIKTPGLYDLVTIDYPTTKSKGVGC